MSKYLLTLIRWIVGGLFIFSGMIKVNDPVGTAIKLEEYFDVFSYDISPLFAHLKSISLPLSVFLVVLEVVLGVMLILGVKTRLTVILLGLMIVFFTFLTFFSAYFNKVTDCGCFGDAIKLTPWESFYKDLGLLILIGILFFFLKDLPKKSAGWKQIIVVFTLLGSLTLAVLAIRNLPFIDFRAYKEGVHIPSAMQPSEQLQYDYVMKKDGDEFIFDQYPADESYEFVEMKLKNPEALPKISDFSVWNESGEYTEEILAGNQVLILINNLQKISPNNLEAIQRLVSDLNNVEISASVVAASSEEEIRQFVITQNWPVETYLADATVVKTIIRANPGIMLLKDGIILKKFHHNNTPSVEEVKAYFNDANAL
ncbi:BT_3928 family protein [Pararhodonellum marinum]|uniref:BT_3928 family protein n=1 Tax=Pararhodonellum marinum TaxID=2755358 RepID=UPI00188E6F3A|nr:BT_3928 family protein [Pararhodonellum marinum]